MKLNAEVSEKMELIERSMMELGTEVYNLRGSITKGKQQLQEVLSVMQGLKRLLDEKGLITVEDFDAAVELGEVLERFQSTMSAQEDDLLKQKKVGH